MKPNKVEFKVSGRYALFSDPINRMGGEKISYFAPTYEALKGILSSVYWKPGVIWVIDKVRVMKPIQTQSQGIRPLVYGGSVSNTLSIYNYLADVEYQILAHFEWNMNRPDLIEDRNENKHHNIAKRCIERGGRRDVFLGTRECQAYVEPCEFGSGEGAYDDIKELSFGNMFHGFTYPDEGDSGDMIARFWSPVMREGVIEFPRPEACKITRKLLSKSAKEFSAEKGNFTSVEDFDIIRVFGGEGE